MKKEFDRLLGRDASAQVLAGSSSLPSMPLNIGVIWMQSASYFSGVQK
jgi:hypothetical protein